MRDVLHSFVASQQITRPDLSTLVNNGALPLRDFVNEADSMWNGTAPDTRFLSSPPILTVQANIMPEAESGIMPKLTSPVIFYGMSQQSLPTHITILQGNSPQKSDILQIVLTPDSAQYLHVNVGDVLTPDKGYPFFMQVVGLFQPKSSSDLLLPASYIYSSNQGYIQNYSVVAMVSTEGLLSTAENLAKPSTTVYWANASLSWHYQLDSQHATINQLGSMTQAFTDIMQENAIARDILPVDELQQYEESVSIASVPILATSILTIGLILLFLSLMAQLLVEREANIITLLRSRGAARRQLFCRFWAVW